MYIQVIPLALKSDAVFCDYIREHIEELNDVSGADLQFVVPRELEAGDVSGIAALIRSGAAARYPGLLWSDLPCFWLEDEAGGQAIIRAPASSVQIATCIRAMTDAARSGAGAPGIKAWVRSKAARDLGERHPDAGALMDIFRPLLGELQMSKFAEKCLAFGFGVAFVITILVMAVFFPQPSLFQYQVFRIVLAMACAGAISMTPGFLEVRVSNIVRAGGALAVFVILFFYNPASLVVQGSK